MRRKLTEDAERWVHMKMLFPTTEDRMWGTKKFKQKVHDPTFPTLEQLKGIVGEESVRNWLMAKSPGGYNENAKAFSPQQVILIYQYLGEP